MIDVRDVLSEEGLTQTEMSIALNLLAGLTNKGIGSVLIMKEKTVKGHITNILRKTETTSRAEFIVKYLPIQVFYLNSLDKGVSNVYTQS